MLQTVKHVLDKKCIVLASSSPRRSQILHSMGLSVEVYPSMVDESLSKSLYPEYYQYAIDTASMKTRHVLDELLRIQKPVDVVIGADTIIVYGNQILEKPKDTEDAFRMLNLLNGNTHEVITGVCLAWKDETNKYSFSQFHETTKVQMANVDPDVWDGYIETGEPMDKAGGYGIQSLGGSLVKGIEGDYYNVVGLPVHKLMYHLYRLVKDKRLFSDESSPELAFPSTAFDD